MIGSDLSIGQQSLILQKVLDRALQFHAAGRLNEAKGEYQEILRSDPNQPDALHLLGLISQQQGDSSLAVDLIKRALTIKPDNAKAHNNLANALKELGRLDEAVASYQKALDIEPDFAEAHSNLGGVLQELGKLDEAVACCLRALVLMPDFAEAQNNLGLAFQGLGKLYEAEASFNKALDAKAGFAEADNNLGNALTEMGRLDEAVAHYDRAIANKPDYAEAHSNLARAHQNLGKLDEAVASYSKALAINPDYADAHNSLGSAFKQLGRLNEAEECYLKALAIKPEYAEALSNLGNAFKEMGRLDEAVASYHKALEINPGFAAAHYNLHSLILDPDNMMPSITCMERAVAIDPNDTNYRFFLGLLLDFAGSSKQAAAHFEMVESGNNPDRAKLDAWRYIKSSSKKLPLIIGSSIQAFKLGIGAAVKDGLVLEFGVRFGTSIRQIAELVNQTVHGFDSFKGLPEAWHSLPKGSYSTKGEIPSVQENVVLLDGWFEETLPIFIEKHHQPIRFMNIDCDIYSSTKTVLDILAKQVSAGTVIAFDEYIGNETWREDEFRAFQEAVLKYGWKYEYLCFSFTTRQVVIRII
ncbi:MAG: tetratricopeptide repeat protein [Rhodospirillales bacterium]|nr:tetratricopeptide repeat protein [Rhodospirillales bacterium]